MPKCGLILISMWIPKIRSLYAKIGAFPAVQFACMAKDVFRQSRCRCYTQEFSSSSLQIRETKFAFPMP